MVSKKISSKHSKKMAPSLELPLAHRKRFALSKKLLPYQKDAVKAAIDKKTCAIYFEPRTGKTFVTGGILNELSLFNTLLIVPLATKERTWARFLREYTSFSVFTDLDEFNRCNSSRILLLHYEAVNAVIHRLKKMDWDIIVYDESHRLKARNSRQSRNSKNLRNRASRKLILTGTPLEKSPMDLWAQFRFLNPSVLGDRWADFDNEFLRPDGYMGYGRKFINKKLPEFLARIDPYCIRITQGEVGFPEIEIIEEPVTLWGKQREIYDQLENESLLKDRGYKISAPFPMTRITKLQQICGGFVLDDGGRNIRVGEAKIRRVKTLLKKYPKPFIICCRYIAEIEGLADELKNNYRVAVLTGEVRRAGLADSIIDGFQQGKEDVLIMQTTLGKEGIDLSIAKHCIIYSLTFSSLDFDQVKNRMQNLLHKVSPKLFLIWAEDTIDEPIYSAIVKKHRVKDSVLSYLKRR